MQYLQHSITTEYKRPAIFLLQGRGEANIPHPAFAVAAGREPLDQADCPRIRWERQQGDPPKHKDLTKVNRGLHSDSPLPKAHSMALKPQVSVPHLPVAPKPATRASTMLRRELFSYASAHLSTSPAPVNAPRGGAEFDYW